MPHLIQQARDLIIDVGIGRRGRVRRGLVHVTAGTRDGGLEILRQLSLH